MRPIAPDSQNTIWKQFFKEYINEKKIKVTIANEIWKDNRADTFNGK